MDKDVVHIYNGKMGCFFLNHFFILSLELSAYLRAMLAFTDSNKL